MSCLPDCERERGQRLSGRLLIVTVAARGMIRSDDSRWRLVRPSCVASTGPLAACSLPGPSSGQCPQFAKKFASIGSRVKYECRVCPIEGSDENFVPQILHKTYSRDVNDTHASQSVVRASFRFVFGLSPRPSKVKTKLVLPEFSHRLSTTGYESVNRSLGGRRPDLCAKSTRHGEMTD